MKINRINILQNFGLNKTNRCKKVEAALLKTASKQGKEENAATIANGLTELVPNAVLDVAKIENFPRYVLYDKKVNGKYKSAYDVSFINKELPVETLAFLYTNLRKYEQGDMSNCRRVKKDENHKLVYV